MTPPEPPPPPPEKKPSDPPSAAEPRPPPQTEPPVKLPVARHARSKRQGYFDEDYKPRRARWLPTSDQAWNVVIVTIVLLMLVPCAGIGYFAITCKLIRL